MVKQKHIFSKRVLLSYGPNALKMRLRDGFAYRRREGLFLRTPWFTFSWHSARKVLYVRFAARWLSLQPSSWEKAHA